MNLRKEVIHRLVLAKSILDPARNVAWAQPNAHLVAKFLLSAHDAADLAFAAIADHMNKHSAKNRAPSMIECLSAIGASASIHGPYFRSLNEARNGLKHTGNLPNTHQWARVGDEIFERISNLCEVSLGLLLEDVDESELLVNTDAKAHFSSAKQARATGDLKAALEELGKALYISLHNSAVTGIRVGMPKAEDALKLTAFGVSVNDFLSLQEFLPTVHAESVLGDPSTVLWKQSGFGHPGNWQIDVVNFCLGAYLSVALAIQSAPWTPQALELSVLYDYKVTANERNVEVWEDFVNEALEHIGPDNSRAFRSHKRYLEKGESITVPATVPHFVSDDLSLDGVWIKRVRVSPHESLSGLGRLHDDEKAEFVDRASVDITCVPVSYYKEVFENRFPNLNEIPWEEDPYAFSI